LTVLLGNSDERAEREASYLDLFDEQRVFGLLISPVGQAEERLQRLRAHGTATVLVDRVTDDAEFSSVSVDDIAGGRMAVQHLIDTGRRRIAFVGGPHGLRQVADRLAGAQDAAAEAEGVELEVIPTQSATVLEGRRIGESIRERAATDRPDAVFAANDLIAMGVLQALNMAGSVHVPDDIALIGYDDIGFASAAVVPLSSVRQPSELIGSTAVDLLLREVEGGDGFQHERVVFQPELVVRESTAPRAAR
jgi:LacI family transcriptional regulator